MDEKVTLDSLKTGETAVINGLSRECRTEVRQRLLDLGFVKGAEISVQNVSPLKDPVAYNIHDTLISLRREDAAQVFIKLTDNII